MGGVAVTRPVTWQLEYPGQAPEAEKDKMVWEILVSERDIRALVPLAKVRGHGSSWPGWGHEGGGELGAEPLPCTPRLRSFREHGTVDWVPRVSLCALSPWTVAELCWR